MRAHEGLAVSSPWASITPPAITRFHLKFPWTMVFPPTKCDTTHLSPECGEAVGRKGRWLSYFSNVLHEKKCERFHTTPFPLGGLSGKEVLNPSHCLLEHLSKNTENVDDATSFLCLNRHKSILISSSHNAWIVREYL